MPAYLAVPDRADAARVPGLIVLHEIFGLNDDIRRIADRFAREGYAALAPDLYAGQGMRPFCILRTFLTLGRGEGPAFEAIERARAFLCERDEVDPSRIGIAGFCMGGSFALLFAARAPLGAAESRLRGRVSAAATACLLPVGAGSSEFFPISVWTTTW